MRRFLILLALTAVVILTVGYYRNWFTVSSETAAGTSEISIKVDREKIKSDRDKAVEDVKAIVHPANEKTTK